MPSNSNSQENGIHQIGKNGLFQIGEDEQDNNSSSLSSESDLAESPAGQTIRSSYKSPIFDQHHLEPCPVNGCPLNPQSTVITYFTQCSRMELNIKSHNLSQRLPSMNLHTQLDQNLQRLKKVFYVVNLV